MTAKGHLTAVVVLLGAAACSHRDAWWVDQLEATSPCLQVDLVDGLDAANTAELHHLFACLDHFGHLAPLRPVDAALDASTRASTPVGVELANALAPLQRADLDPFASAAAAAQALADDTVPIDTLLGLWVELTYGTSVSQVYDGRVDLADPDALAVGVWAPLGAVIPRVASAWLDENPDELALGAAFVTAEAPRWLVAIEAAVRSSDPGIANPMSALLGDLGEAITAAHSPANDRWTKATGNSLRDAITLAMVGPAPLSARLSAPLARVLEDDELRAAFPDHIDAQTRQGDLTQALAGLYRLTAVDGSGQPVVGTRESAYRHLARLAGSTLLPQSCTVETSTGAIEWTFGALGEAVLVALAEAPVDPPPDADSLLLTLSGGLMSEADLSAAIDAGTCASPSTTDLADLRAINRLSDDDASALWAVGHGTLVLLHEHNHLADAVDVFAEVQAADGIGASEELVRDLALTPLLTDLVALIPAMFDPASAGLTAEGVAPIDLAAMLELLRFLVADNPLTSRTGFELLSPLIAPALDADETWVAVANLGTLLSDGDSEASAALQLLRPLVALDPTLSSFETAGRLLVDPTLTTPVLRTLESEVWTGAWAATSQAAGQDEVPLTFIARVIVDDTVSDLLELVDGVFVAAGGP